MRLGENAQNSGVTLGDVTGGRLEQNGIVNLVWPSAAGMIGGLISVGGAGLMAAVVPSYKGFRYPVEIISHCVWLYYRFPLSFREVEEMMLERGVVVTYETIRQWCRKFGQAFANGLRRRRARPGDSGISTRCSSRSTVRPTTCGVLSIRTAPCWTSWSPLAVMPRPPPGFSARCSLGCGPCRGCWSLTKLGSYGVAPRRLMRSVEHRRSKYLNNRAENSHQPTRQRERAMKRFRSAGGAQRFLSAFSAISPHFRPRRHRLTAVQYRHEMTTRFTSWHQVTRLTPAAS
jgi:putative transposase